MEILSWPNNGKSEYWGAFAGSEFGDLKKTSYLERQEENHNFLQNYPRLKIKMKANIHN